LTVDHPRTTRARLAPADSLQRITDGYDRTAVCNDAIWELFTQRTNETPLLKEHRDWIEAHDWGFGDRAFHYLWLLVIQELADTMRAPLRMLEIGVYKGQTLSLWSLIAREIELDVQLYGISPLIGKPPMPRLMHRARMLVDSVYRQDAKVGNLHTESDFASDIHTVFSHFGLDATNLTLIKGFSQDEDVLTQVKAVSFDVVYIDGGHRYDEASSDLRMYSPLVRNGGYLVLDDASFFEPGSVFFKGFESVSRAARELDPREFRNVLNVGHNRVYQRAIASSA
jgi:hypothetical protein